MLFQVMVGDDSPLFQEIPIPVRPGNRPITKNSHNFLLPDFQAVIAHLRKAFAELVLRANGTPLFFDVGI